MHDFRNTMTRRENLWQKTSFDLMKWQMKQEQYEMNGDTKHKVIDNEMVINIQILSPASINQQRTNY